ncbi:hypothetical protein HD554DRAFT_2020459 [Boletus coccyginus]|nr:hypothetical protein HD554DRAFT_2020459 [Boletus coccyginus]
MNFVPVINHPCTICCRPTSMWCSRCQAAWYCTPEHLSDDWSCHREECIPVPVDRAQNYNIIDIPAAAEQQLIMVFAILFSPEEDQSPFLTQRPRIISIKCRPSQIPSQGICPQPLVASHFTDGPAQSIVLTRGLNAEPLRFPLHLWYSPTALSHSAPVNRAIYCITSSATTKAWSGTVVVLKFNGSRRQGYSNAGSNNLPALFAYFLAHK